MSVKWIKIGTQMFDDEKIKLIEQMPEADTILIIWIKLLVQAGKTNASGYIYLNKNIPYTEEMLSAIFNRPLNTIRLALKTLEQFGMIEVDSNRQIYISNWERHQNVEGMDRIREQTRQRVAKHRQVKQIEQLESERSVTSNVTVTQGNATDIDIELDKERDIRTKETKTRYAEFVLLTETEHKNLLDSHGETFINRCIEVLDNYKGANGKKYKSDYRAILNWVVKRVKDEGASIRPSEREALAQQRLAKQREHEEVMTYEPLDLDGEARV